MSTNEAQWDARYRATAEKEVTAGHTCVTLSGENGDIVSEWLPLLPRGAALDLACGAGRHSLLLAAQGRAVTAVDASGAAIELLEKRAREIGLVTNRSEPGAEILASENAGVCLVQADLETVILPEEEFALILCIRYLQRSLFAQISRSLMPGGLLLFETFTMAQLRYESGPRNPEHLLATGELRSAFPELHMLFYRELNAGQGIASLVARKPQNGAVGANG